jgi:non-canonical poly(A) RNA polymerase PAPD5/7
VALIKEYLDIYPQLRSLTFILKKFIYCARLFDPYSGGISSYGLILMIVAFIQNMNREKKLNEKENTTLS